MKLDSESLSRFAKNIDSINELACAFVISVEKNRKNPSREFQRAGTPEASEISINSSGIQWNFEYNDSCNCHPEYLNYTETYSFDDFIEYLKENKLDVEHMDNSKPTILKDAVEIVRRLKERNPEFLETIKEQKISLEDFAEIVITQYKAFNNIL